MKRTQIYLDDQLWAALHARAQAEKTTVSELVRKAVQERYSGNLETRRAAMERFVGIRQASAGDPTRARKSAACGGATGWTGSVNGDDPRRFGRSSRSPERETRRFCPRERSSASPIVSFFD